jgi:hypothetical protein
VELSFVSAGIIAVAVAVFNYRRINAKREKALQGPEGMEAYYSPEQLREMGDLAPDFRYTL